ncbi:MAG TPA: cupin domain-containing protein [Patescibacteria group bacterium]|nr:cupin domain-containing protein [Patescibacteria group bacterium]
MKIITKSEAFHADKPEGISVDYYLFPEYEIHFNSQAPHTTQVWHHHQHIWETIFILKGELLVMWKQDGKEIHQLVTAGDVIETERTPHTFMNNSQNPAEFLVIKQILSGQDKSALLKKDKVLD